MNIHDRICVFRAREEPLKTTSQMFRAHFAQPESIEQMIPQISGATNVLKILIRIKVPHLKITALALPDTKKHGIRTVNLVHHPNIAPWQTITVHIVRITITKDFTGRGVI